jgi:DNA-binding NtrC family response regulator
LTLRNDGHRFPEGGPEWVTKNPALWAMAATDKARTGHEMNTILVIEDDWAVRELFRIELAEEGFNIVAIGEVESIWEKIRASNPDLVVLDIYMKGKFRWDVLVDIKEENPKLPVIIATDFGNYTNDPHLLSVDGYWIKSYRFFDDLIQKIGEVLQRKQKI